MDDIRSLIRLTRLTPSQLAKRLQIHDSTLRRYRRSNSAPGAVQTALRLLAGVEAPAPDPAWQNWRFEADTLRDPNGVSYHQHEIQAIWIMRQQVQLLREIQRNGYQYRLF